MNNITGNNTRQWNCNYDHDDRNPKVGYELKINMIKTCIIIKK